MATPKMEFFAPGWWGRMQELPGAVSVPATGSFPFSPLFCNQGVGLGL